MGLGMRLSGGSLGDVSISVDLFFFFGGGIVVWLSLPLRGVV